MCRMMGVVGSRDAALPLLARFRDEASAGRVARGAAPGHRDGWGIVAPFGGHVAHAGRSTADASVDPLYPKAIAKLAEADARGAFVAHVRKQTLGARTIENTHPFVDGGLAFAHNGTVEGIAAPGENDSRVLFARLLAETRKGASVEDALRSLAREAQRRTFTSLTLLVTDGRALWGLRKVGNHPTLCAPEACAPDYYTLGFATLPDGSVVVSQEHEILGIEGWKPVPDEGIVSVAPDGDVRIA